ncbi:MAG: nucleotidyl transferase AbiEii/AbiGii toxin family protein [Patescibacteria group bacterium]
MLDLHTNVLTKEAKMLFPFLAHFKDDFYVAGGTGLALQIGHRISVDFDLFSLSPIKKTFLKKVEEVFKGKTLKILVNNESELTLFVGEVKCTFLYYPFPVILSLVQASPIPLLSAKEILVTKAYTIGRRGELKDYVDIYSGLKRNCSILSEVIDVAKKKYGEAFNDRLFLEQLLYTEDLENIAITMLDGNVPSKMEMINYFSEIIKNIVL